MISVQVLCCRNPVILLHYCAEFMVICLAAHIVRSVLTTCILVQKVLLGMCAYIYIYVYLFIYIYIYSFMYLRISGQGHSGITESKTISMKKSVQVRIWIHCALLVAIRGSLPASKNPKPSTLNLKPSLAASKNPKSSTLNPKP